MISIQELARDSVYAAILHLAPRFSNVLLFILIGRLSGPSQAGIFTLATTYLLIFSSLTKGVDDLTLREVARRPEKSLAFLNGFLILRFLVSLVFYALLFVIIQYFFKYSPQTNQVILILAICLFPDSLSYVVQAVLLGQRRFALPALTFTGVSMIKLICGGWIAITGGSLVLIAWIWVASSTIGFLFLLTRVLLNYIRAPKMDWFDWRLIGHILPVVIPFFIITSLTTLETQGDTIVLSYFHGEKQVGWYNAATTIAYSLGLISQAFRMSIYPVMARYAHESSPHLTRLYQETLRYLGLIALPMVTGIALLAPQIVSLLFGQEFEPTILTLQILIPVLIFTFLNVPSARMMLVKDRQGWISVFLVCSSVTNLFLNILLDPDWGARGAAFARSVSSAIYFILLYIFVERNIVRANIFKLLSRPLASALIMGCIVWLMRGLPLPLVISVGVISFFAFLWLIGGLPDQDLHRLRQLASLIRKPGKP